MPPIGFQAPLGLSAMPSASQPFQGKSLSFTVRTNIGEARPAIASYPMFSIPAENSTLTYSRLTV